MADDKETQGAEDDAMAAYRAVGLDWSCRLKEVQRVEADPEDDDLDDVFAVTFMVDGPNAEAEVEIMVPDATDLEVVAVALDTLHGALVAWADLIRRRRDGARAGSPEV